MIKTIIIGNNDSKSLAHDLNATLIKNPDLHENDLGAINNFVVEKLNQQFDILIIDADNGIRTEVALAIGMYMRLSLVELSTNALKPIIIVSDKRIKSFMNVKTYSQILLTKNVYFQSRSDIRLEAVAPIDSKKYKEDFLEYINIPLGATEGRHSIANQWGASLLDRLMNNGVQSDYPVFNEASKSIYFKFMLAQTQYAEDILQNKRPIQYYLGGRPKIDAKGKRILLIDDEVEKGWEYVFKNLLLVDNEDDFKTIGHKSKNYYDFSEDERKLIENENEGFDLIFLDLRMNGIEEKDVYKPEEFSGMKILTQIKKIQPGTQIIMLTASNKAWNLKALLDAGADGYYIKESPEYNFTLGFSLANYDVLRKNIKNCLNKSYLRSVCKSINAITVDLNKSNADSDFISSLTKQIKASYALLTSEHFEYAYVSLCQVLELVNDYFTYKNESDWVLRKTNEPVKNWIINFKANECIASDESFSDSDNQKLPEWKKMAAIYYQLWKQEDKHFGYNIQKIIDERNRFMHNKSRKTSSIHSEQGYINILSYIEIIAKLV